jgi:release factor glutamine methyltransferase
MFYPEKIFLTSPEQKLFFEMLSRYKKNEPISKILNSKSFWKHDFYVNGDVLDPRPETEFIIECVLKNFDTDAFLSFLDIGTGSGCILLSLLAEFKNATGVGIDISPKALETALYNSERLKIENCEFMTADWNDLLNNRSPWGFNGADCLEKSLNNKLFDIIVSNPPYIRSADIPLLEENVRNCDPLTALDGGSDGLQAFREICKLAPKILRPNGSVFLEVGQGQAQDVQNIMIDNGFIDITVTKDLQKIKRILKGRI